MASEVEICNLALARIRTSSINSLDEQSVQAQQCKLFYNLSLDVILEDARWGFAHKLDALAVLTDELHNWAYVYQYPSDCIRINYLVRESDQISAVTGNSATASRAVDLNAQSMGTVPPPEYEIFNIDGNRVIAANEGCLRADYNVSISDPNLFSSKFKSTLAYLLASDIAVPIMGAKAGQELSAQLLAKYAAFVSDAEDNSGNQRQFDQPDSDFITVRG